MNNESSRCLNSVCVNGSGDKGGSVRSAVGRVILRDGCLLSGNRACLVVPMSALIVVAMLG